MKNVHELVAHASMSIQRAFDGVIALRKDAALARHASDLAQLPRRSQAELRTLYVAPAQVPLDDAKAARAGRSGPARYRGHGLGQRGLTALAVCVVLVFVVAIALPHHG
jgi:hypothetical protein